MEQKETSPEPKSSNWLLALKLFFIGGIGMQILFSPINETGSWTEFFQNSAFQGIMWIVLWFGNGWLNDVMTTKYGWDKPVLVFMLRNLATVIWSLFLAYTLFSIYYYLIGDRSFIETAKAIWQSLNFFTIFSISAITLIVSLFLHGQQFLLNWKESILETERLKKAQIASQYETLKNQVNPHFLFNSLNVLSTLVYKDQDLAAKFIKQLSASYRYVLETREKEVIALADEVKAVESFLFLMKIRFGENLQFDLDIPTNSSEKIVPLTLQMLVENAIKHNIISKNKPLTIQLTKEDNEFIKVSNNLQKKNQSLDSMGIGLPNITDRYQYLSSKEIRIEETTNEFVVYVPILELQ